MTGLPGASILWLGGLACDPLEMHQLFISFKQINQIPETYSLLLQISGDEFMYPGLGN